MVDQIGYDSDEYMNSYLSLGTVVTLPDSGLRLIKRQISDDLYDLVGLYPYSDCSSLENLPGKTDQAFLSETGAVSISFVLSPFKSSQVECLRGWDFQKVYKEHFVMHLSKDWRQKLTKKTRYYVRKSERLHETQIVPASYSIAQSFHEMYQHTVRRHRIGGVQNFSVDAVYSQMLAPGAFILRSSVKNSCSGYLIGMINRHHANYHLVALSEQHYGSLTNYALLAGAADFCVENDIPKFNLGSGAGYESRRADGLYQFKSKWTSRTLQTHICGKVLRPSDYRTLASQAGVEGRSFFPIYRMPGSRFEWSPSYA